MLTVLTTHPIQYQVPVWKGLAARKKIPLKVFYMSDQGLVARFDPGFGKSLSWEIDLLGGYESEFLDTYKGHRSDSFWWLRLKRGFGRALRGIGADVLWDPGLAGGGLLAGCVRSATNQYRGMAPRRNERAQQRGPDGPTIQAPAAARISWPCRPVPVHRRGQSTVLPGTGY